MNRSPRRFAAPLFAALLASPALALAQAPTAAQPTAAHHASARPVPAQLVIEATNGPVDVTVRQVEGEDNDGLSQHGHCAPTCTFTVDAGRVRVAMSAEPTAADWRTVDVPRGALRIRAEAHPLAPEASSPHPGRGLMIGGGVTLGGGLLFSVLGALIEPPSSRASGPAVGAVLAVGVLAAAPNQGGAVVAGTLLDAANRAGGTQPAPPPDRSLNDLMMGFGIATGVVGLILIGAGAAQHDRAEHASAPRVAVVPDLQRPGATLTVHF